MTRKVGRDEARREMQRGGLAGEEVDSRIGSLRLEAAPDLKFYTAQSGYEYRNRRS